MSDPSEKIEISDQKIATAEPYAVLTLVQAVATDIAEERTEKIKFLKHQYALGIEPDAHEIARAILAHLTRAST